MADVKKFLDQSGTSYLWGKIKAGLDAKADASDVTAINTKLGTLPTGKTDFATWIAAVEAAGYDDTEILAAVAANAGDIDALETLVGSKAVATQISDAITALSLASTYAAKSYEGKVDTLIGDDSSKSARTIANEELAKQLIPENADEALNTLAEIAAWIQAHPNDAAAMNASIEENADDIATNAAAIDALELLVGNTAVATQISNAINALNLATTYYSKASGEANAAAIAAIKDGASIDSFADVETALAGKQATIAANTYDAYGSAAAVLGTATDASTAATVYGVKAYADSLATNYATAAQGTKADSALQSSDVIALTNTEIDTAIANATSA